MQCAYSDACWAQIVVIVAIELHWFVIIVYVWDVHDWLSIVISPSENIKRKRVILKNSAEPVLKGVADVVQGGMEGGKKPSKDLNPAFEYPRLIGTLYN